MERAIITTVSPVAIYRLTPVHSVIVIAGTASVFLALISEGKLALGVW